MQLNIRKKSPKSNTLSFLKSAFSVLFFLAYGWSVNAQESVLDQTVRLKVKSANTLEVLHEIEKQVVVNFIYNPNDLDKKTSFSFPKKRLAVREVLNQLFEKQALSYRADNQQIILYQIAAQNMGFRVNKAPPKKKEVVFSGYLQDAKTGEALIAASIYEEKTFTATTSNNFGFFSLTLPAGKHTIIISFVGYESQKIRIDESEQVNIKLQAVSSQLTEVVVRAEETTKAVENVVNKPIGIMRIESERLKSIPALAGEADVLKAVTLLPGIKPGVEGAAGFYVRGGGPDQNLILLDGVPMYNPYHLFGFLSTFNPDAINNIEVTKGAFPARYAGRLSSVLDITTKDGNNQEWKKQLSLGLLSAKVSADGPLIKDRSSISVSARRTLLDLIISPIAAERASGFKRGINYNFGDINLKYNYKLSNKDKFYVSGFYSRDGLKIRERSKDKEVAIQTLRDREGWQNGFGSFRWNHLFNDKIFLNTTAYYSNYDYFTNKIKEVDSADENLIPNVVQEEDYQSSINDFAIKQDYHYFLNPTHNIRFGGSAIFHAFKPGVNTFYQKTGENIVRGASLSNTTHTQEYGLYLEDDMSLGKRLSINLGIHASGFAVEDTFYTALQPRVGFGFLINDQLSIKGGYAQMTQYLHLLTSSELSRATDLWVPVTRETAPAQSTQYSFGTALTIGDYGIELEGYYKKMNQLIDYQDGIAFALANENWKSKVGSGIGESYGGEVFLQKRKGRLTGWLGYTLSWTNRTFTFLNGGESFPYRYDRRHDISLVANYKWNEKWSFNGTWVFYSGGYATIPTLNHINPNFQFDDKYAWFQFPNEQEAIFEIFFNNPGINSSSSKRNNYKLPDYHRLDLAATMKTTTKKDRTATWVFGLTNAYNRFNPWRFNELTRDPNVNDASRKLTLLSLFPIMPTVNYTISF